MTPLETLDPARFDTPAILKWLAASGRRLAELKGMAGSIPNQGILINTLGLQEAKDSSEIENIVTTHDELFRDDVHPESFANPAAKEVLRCRQALQRARTSIAAVPFDDASERYPWHVLHDLREQRLAHVHAALQVV